MRFNEQIVTPRGPATVVGRGEKTGEYFVRYDRGNFSPEAWKTFTPYGGPCTFDFTAEVEKYSETPALLHYNGGSDEQIYQTKGGRRYHAIERAPGKVKIRCLEDGLTWWTSEKSFNSRFHPV